MRNPETKRSFGLLGRYAAIRGLSSPSGVIQGAAASIPDVAADRLGLVMLGPLAPLDAAPLLASRRRPGSISAWAPAFRQCDRILDVGIWPADA
jgi:hypothetical protein